MFLALLAQDLGITHYILLAGSVRSSECDEDVEMQPTLEVQRQDGVPYRALLLRRTKRVLKTGYDTREQKRARSTHRTDIRRPDWLSHESTSQWRGNADLLGSRRVDGLKDKHIGMRMQIARRSSMRRTGRLLFAEPNRLETKSYLVRNT